MGNRQHTTRHLDHEGMAVGTHAFKVGVRRGGRLSLQWINHAEAVGASAAITLHGALSDRKDDLANTDPTANFFWSPLVDASGTAIAFPADPAAAEDSEILSPDHLEDVAVTTVLVVITVSGADYTDFSLLSRVSW